MSHCEGGELLLRNPKFGHTKAVQNRWARGFEETVTSHCRVRLILAPLFRELADDGTCVSRNMRRFRISACCILLKWSPRQFTDVTLSVTVHKCFYLPPWSNSPSWARCTSLLRFHDRTQLHTSYWVGFFLMSDQLGIDLYLTAHGTQIEKHPCPWRDLNPQSQQLSGRRPTP